MTRRSILITGAGAGIGRATARLFLAEGWDVTLLGRRLAALEDTAQGQPARMKGCPQPSLHPGALPVGHPRPRSPICGWRGCRAPRPHPAGRCPPRPPASRPNGARSGPG